MIKLVPARVQDGRVRGRRSWYGASDEPWVPMSADYLLANIPDVTLVTYPAEAHLFPFDHWAEMLTAMV